MKNASAVLSFLPSVFLVIFVRKNAFLFYHLLFLFFRVVYDYRFHRPPLCSLFFSLFFFSSFQRRLLIYLTSFDIFSPPPPSLRLFLIIGFHICPFGRQFLHEGQVCTPSLLNYGLLIWTQRSNSKQPSYLHRIFLVAFSAGFLRTTYQIWSGCYSYGQTIVISFWPLSPRFPEIGPFFTDSDSDRERSRFGFESNSSRLGIWKQTQKQIDQFLSLFFSPFPGLETDSILDPVFKSGN